MYCFNEKIVMQNAGSKKREQGRDNPFASLPLSLASYVGNGYASLQERLSSTLG